MSQSRLARSVWCAAALSFAGACVALAIAGTYRAYSPVPHYDMWGGYFGFLDKVANGDASAFWAQHNEHRIVLSRVLFLVDFYVFNGTNVFLFAMNFVLAGSSAMIFCLLLKQQNRINSFDVAFVVASSLIVGWLFSGMQFGNFSWAFQSGFFLAQLLPLAAFVAMGQAATRVESTAWFSFACLLGIASVGTLASGVLVLPLLAAQALWIKQSRHRIAILAVLAIIAITAYLTNYEPVVRHGSPWLALRNQPAEVILYFLLLVGCPWFYIAGGHAGAERIALAGGFVFVAFTLLAVKSVMSVSPRGPRVALCFFIVYIACFAIVTAAGRLFVGIEEATTSRYTTPVLMAWVALFVLASPSLFDWSRQNHVAAMLVVVLIAAALLRVQWESRDWRPSDPEVQDLLGISLSLNTNDDQRVRQAYLFVEEVYRGSAWAKQHHASFYAVSPFDRAEDQLGRAFPLPGDSRCSVAIDSREGFDGDQRFVRISGWLNPPRRSAHRYMLRVLDADRRLIGLAVSGFRLSNDKRAALPRGEGFKGYMLKSGGLTDAFVTIDALSCSARIALPTQTSVRTPIPDSQTVDR